MNPLEILELKPGSTEEDASKNYRRLSLLHHPDKPTGNVERFHEISAAWEYIRAHPEALETPESYTDSYSPFVYINLSVTLEDLYYETHKKLVVQHKALCSSCHGTGSTLKHKGTCGTCGGKGVAESRALRLMGRQSGGPCPACKGRGFKPGTKCKSCQGEKTVLKTATHMIKLKPEHYHKKYILLREQGDSLPDGSVTDLCIRLDIEKDFKYSFEEGMLCRKVLVTPAQQYVRDTIEVDVFGKKVQCKVPAYDKEVIIGYYDSKSQKAKQILLRIEITKPIITDKTKAMYREILEEEKRLLGGKEPHSVEVPF